MRKGAKKNRKRKKTVGVKDLPPKAKGGVDARGGHFAKIEFVYQKPSAGGTKIS